ncbi:MAG TPA: hypothetical protein PLP42_13030, partial [Acidobacteriota bacterium]|nr:hypothetical protein [Acidobacteriota bacterium]
MRVHLLSLAVLLVVVSGPALRAESPLEFVAFLPDVVHGTLAGAYAETIVVVSNAGPDPSEIKITHGLNSAIDSLPQSLTLQPGQSATFKVSAEPFGAGYIMFSSNNPFAAIGHIQVRPSQGSPVLLSEMTVLGQEPISKCAIPVFVNHPVAENTGIVVLPNYGTQLVASLYATDGQLVGSKPLIGQFGRPVMVRLHITELFPDLPEGFQSGCLIVEDSLPAARAFAAMAVYTNGYQLRAGNVSAVDIPVEVTVSLTTPGDVLNQANELAERYHFS